MLSNVLSSGWSVEGVSGELGDGAGWEVCCYQSTLSSWNGPGLEP